MSETGPSSNAPTPPEPAAGGESLARPAPTYNLFSRAYWLGPLDLRPLGFMRIVFGAVLFVAVSDVAPLLFDFFSDQGTAPRAALLQTLTRWNRVSVYDVAGPHWVLVGLFALTLLSILLFTVGFRSRLTSITTFVLVCGLHERNLQVFDGSDQVLRVMLFWLMFMPTGARYSVDAVLRAARGLPTTTHAPALPIRIGQVQICWIYLNTVIHKWPGVEWHDGSALRLALGLDHLFVRQLGQWAFNQEWLIRLGTHATIVVETAMLPLVFLPFGKPTTGRLGRLFARWPAWLFQPTWKALGIAGVTAMHLGIAVLMRVGNFSYIMISTYFLLYEPEWIEAILGGLRRMWGRGQTLVLYDGECVACVRAMATLRGFDAFGNLRLVDATGAGGLAGVPGGVSPAALRDRIHVVLPDGGVRSGFSAWLGIAQRVPALAPLGLIGAAPGMGLIGNPLYDRLAAHRKELLPVSAPTPAAGPRLIPDGLRRAVRALVYATLVFLMANCMWFSLPDVAKTLPLVIGGRQLLPPYDVSPSKMPRPIFETIQEIELWQKWDMFSPKPLDHDLYIEGRGELADGTAVDVLRGDRGDGQGPIAPPPVPGFVFTRWTKYINNIVYEPDNSPWTLEFGRFICRRWNLDSVHGRPQLKTFKLYREEHKTPNFGEQSEPWHEQLIWDHHCF